MENSSSAWYKKWWGAMIVIIIIIILSLITAFAFYIYNFTKTIKKEGSSGIKQVELSEEERKLIEGENNYWLGAPNPKITIVEFSDFACPYCKNSFPKIREIGLKYKDSVKIIFRDMPLQETSLELALAGRCAGEQGLFWLMHDKLFQNQGISETEKLIELANQIGADKNKFSSCLNNQKYLNNIQKDFSDGKSLGISGTPTWFVNGNKIEGDVPTNVWEEIIGELLK